MKLNRNHVYWLLQLGGWGFYCLLTYFTAPLFNLDMPYYEVLVLLSIVNGILVTHVFRTIIKRSEWIKLSLAKLAFYLPVASLVMLFVYAAIQTLVGFVFILVMVILDHEAFRIMIEQSGLAKLSEEYWGILFLSYLNIYAVLLIWTLLYFVYHYFENLQREHIKQLAYENKLKEAELNTLKAQINPHFLFNSLNSIRALTYTEPEEAANAISKLSDLLRASLNASTTKSISLGEEVQLARDYLAIEKIRFEDRLNITFDIDESTQNKQVPPLIVQTLVENAVKHGISKLKSGGMVEVISKLVGDVIQVNVINSGQYFPQHDHNGYGVANISRRLRLLYGDRAKFTIRNADANHVNAEVIIPVS